MAPKRTAVDAKSSAELQTTLPLVCIVTLDLEFLEIVSAELSPWFQVVIRHGYDDLARWARQSSVSAVLLDIDTEGEDSFGGLPVLNELRRLNENYTLISLSRARARSVERQALDAGADAHFRNPVDVGELRATLAETLRCTPPAAARPN